MDNFLNTKKRADQNVVDLRFWHWHFHYSTGKQNYLSIKHHKINWIPTTLSHITANYHIYRIHLQCLQETPVRLLNFQSSYTMKTSHKEL
jgi:hypothetical protein